MALAGTKRHNSIAAHEALPALLDLLSGHAIVRSVAVIAELGVADCLTESPKTAQELAQRCGADEDALRRLLRALAAKGVFTETAPPVRYGLTPLSELLRSDRPNSMRDFARLRGGEMYWKAWGALGKAARTGDAAFRHAHGIDHFGYLGKHPAESRLFDDAMRSFLMQVQSAVIEAYDFSRFNAIMDVGGGTGGFLAAILKAHPGLRGILVDLPRPIEHSEEVLASAGVSDRCERIAGDFFAALPKGADAILLSRVLHDFGDDEATATLRNCRRQ